MTPSLEIREEAAKLHDILNAAQDAYRAWEDSNVCRTETQADYDLADAEEAYETFCLEHGFRLLTDSSRLFLRCAKTQIPLVDTDEVIEGEGDELIRVEREYAA